jgi:hypothetical protein
VHLCVGLPKSLLSSGLNFIVLHIYIHSAFFDSANPYNTTGYTTASVGATRMHLNRKPGNSAINKTPIDKSIPV